MMIGRHGDTGSFEYFLRELGYGAWPWVALAPAALAWAASVRDDRRPVLWLGVVWFVMAYSIVSASMTKFHHYILPAIPGLGIVLGCFLDRLWSDRRRVHRRRPRRPAGPAPAGAGHRRPARQPRTPPSASCGCSPTTTSTARPAGPGPTRSTSAPGSSPSPCCWPCAPPPSPSAAPPRAGLLGLAGAAVLCTYFVLDVFMPGVAPYWSQKGVVATLLQEPARPRGAAGGLPDVLAGRELLHEERDLRGPRGGAHRLRQRRQRGEPQEDAGLDGPQPGPPPLLPVRERPREPAPRRLAPRGPAELPRPRPHQQQVRRSPSPSCNPPQKTKGMSSWTMRSLRVFMGASIPWA